MSHEALGRSGYPVPGGAHSANDVDASPLAPHAAPHLREDGREGLSNWPCLSPGPKRPALGSVRARSASRMAWSSPRAVTASGCGFNRSMQQIDGFVP